MRKKTASIWTEAIRNGLIAGAIVVIVALMGMVEAFNDADIIHDLFSLADLFVLGPILILAYLAVQKAAGYPRRNQLAVGAVTGLISGSIIALMVLVGSALNSRTMLLNASPALWQTLTREVDLPTGALVLLVEGLVAGITGFLFFLLPERQRSAVVRGVLWVVILGTLRDQILLARISQTSFLSTFLRSTIFAQSGFRLLGAVIVFLLVSVLDYFLASQKRVAPVVRTREQQKKIRLTQLIVFALVLISLPPLLGLFFSEILDTTGLFILMGLGLNIVVGFAGLLDLGYVAFYAIGAYTMGVLTSPELGSLNLTFWQALPIALGTSFLAGTLLGLPVLRMRGDYLAIVTLGFGEIVRLLALSDWLKPYLGGTQGIQRIAQPQIGSFRFESLQEIYYLILIAIGIVAFIAWRLKDSRLGRSWMAIREDEDVAQAMGINLVLTKLLAFSTGALFAGLSGTLGAAKLTSVYPHSMTFIVSINVLSLIIIGGMASIPGVFVGALVLMGLPGVLTEFEEYRFWFYGVALVVMMLTRPEGLWPEERRKLELHEEEPEEIGELASATPSTTTASDYPGSSSGLLEEPTTGRGE
jgi:branched-chain amino acid transport system permease protein